MIRFCNEKLGEKMNEDSVTSEFLKFQWCQEVSQYGDKLLQRFDEFRKKNMFYDVTLKTTDADLAAHKVVLVACGGMFRSHFVDPKTKKILGNVNEVSFACPAAGLKPILKFAYSGVLEITGENLFPTFLAANVTEMKEVQEICVNIAMSRFIWIADFDGSAETIPCLTSEGKLTSDEQESKMTLENTFTLLGQLLQLNVASFASDETHDAHKSLKNGLSEEDNSFLCFNEVEERWPKLTTVYTSLVKCLYKIKAIKDPSNEEKRNGDAEKVVSKQSTPSDYELETDKKTASETKAEPRKDYDEPKSDESNALGDHPPSHPESTENDELKADEKNNLKPNSEDESTLERKQVEKKLSAENNNEISPCKKTANVANEPKPTTKPRTKSVAVDIRKSASSENKITATPPTAHKRQSSLSKTPLKATTPQPTTNTGPRKKNPAPKPPGPPPASKGAPLSKKTSPLDSPKKSRSQIKTTNGTPGSASKSAPPRPKPPSVKNKRDSGSGANYDDALNPFADDDTAEGRTDEYDNALNPFG